MNQDMSIFSLIVHASFVVQIRHGRVDDRVALQLDRDLRQAVRAAPRAGNPTTSSSASSGRART